MKKRMLASMLAIGFAVSGAIFTGRAAEGRSVAFLGVMTRPVSETLASQLGLAEGMGLVVSRVEEGSPAAKVLQRNDILVKLEDQKLISPRQLAALIHAEKPGTEITFEIIRGGKRQTLSVSLGEREAGPADDRRWDWREMEPWHPGGFHGKRPGGSGFYGPGFMGMGIDPEDIEAMLDAFREEGMRWWQAMPDDFQDQILNIASNVMRDAFGHLDLTPPAGARVNIQTKDVDGKHVKIFSSVQANINLTAVDEDGTSITITGDQDHKTLTIKDSKGNIVYQGPLNTEKDRKKIPKAYRQKVDELEQMADFDVDVDLP